VGGRCCGGCAASSAAWRTRSSHRIREFGSPLAELGREDKQRAIRLLDERGAFTLRRAVEDVSDSMGVSRITVYNYLNAIHR